jgi:hypothetical protein
MRAPPALPGRRRRAPWIAAALVGTLVTAGPGRTEEPPADPPPPAPVPAPTDGEVRERVAQWLGDLLSDAYDVREKARAGLLLHGGRARDLLEAQRDHEDPEVRGAVRAVLDRLEPRPTEPTPPGRLLDVASMGLVTLDARGPLEGIFRRLGQLHEATFVPPADFRTKEAEAHVAAEPAFRALDMIAGVVGLDASAPFDAAGVLTLREAREDAEPVPTAYVGPLRARIVRVTTVRTLGARASTRTHSLAVEVQWSPAVQVVSIHAPRLASVEDGKGGKMEPPPAGGAVTYGVGASSTSIELNLSFQPTDALEPGDRLAAVEVVVPMRLRHGRKWVDWRQPRARAEERAIALPPEMTGGAKGGVVTLRRFEPGERGSLSAVEVLAQLDTEVARESVRTFLIAADGSSAALALSARSVGADGSVELVGRGRFPSGAAPSAVRATWFTVEGRGEARFRLEGVPLR